MTTLTRAAVSSLLLATTMIASTGGLAQSLPAGTEHVHAADAALAAGRVADAVSAGERAVAASPDDARRRTLLGRAYLAGGRFASAETMFGEALMLDPQAGPAAGGLVLALLAQRRPGAARATLVDHGRFIAPADLGLLVALSGDPAGGASLLQRAARDPAAGVRTRQNLALAYALAGHWPLARATAAIDLGDTAAEARMLDWSARSAGGLAAHVAAMAGPAAATDPGRPMLIALGASPRDRMLAAQDASEPLPAVPVPVRPLIAAALPAPAPVQAAMAPIRFAGLREIVQPLPAGYRTASAPAARLITVGAPAQVAAPAAGYVVQLGAYATPALALAGWDRIRGTMPSLSGRPVLGAATERGGGRLFRVALGGFAGRREAARYCEAVRRRGSSCFVRQVDGDRAVELAFATTGPARFAAR